ncbi:MAG: hypothetical protein K8H87_02405 [Pseudorhodoplanes sp.]|nr:hypothetical protein [Pseudorhodoplanes sp.]
MSAAAREDAAWVRIPTGLSPTVLVEFSQDVERLLRINSLYEFQEWRSVGQNSFFMRARNLGNGSLIETALRVIPRPDGIRVVYESGLKTSTDFHVESADMNGPPVPSSAVGAVLVVTDDYSGTTEDERRARSTEVDTSLVSWGRDLQRYLRHWQRWSRFDAWRWYMRHVWQPMRPSARRISFVLIVIAAIEIALTLLVVLGFYLFRAE